MATVAGNFGGSGRVDDVLSGTPRAHAIDRWIYVFTAASFIAVTLAGFIPDSLGKIAAVQAGQRPPFPLVLHFHAVLMGSFLILLFAQTWLMATGRRDLHMRLGLLGIILAPLLVIAGFILAPTMYHQVWAGAQHAAPAIREQLQARLSVMDDILLLQLRIGILFPLFLAIGLKARGGNAGMHKRMMILATVMAIPASVDRITWLPSSMPSSQPWPATQATLNPAAASTQPRTAHPSRQRRPINRGRTAVPSMAQPKTPVPNGPVPNRSRSDSPKL